MTKSCSIVTIVAGALFLASPAAHAFLGFPPQREVLARASVDTDTATSLAVGWYFGSAAMVAFGAIALAAFLACEMNPHFLGFIAMGALLGVGSFGARSIAAEADRPSGR
ncbi:MAG: hypothetical protein EXS13_10855 [Planctomycetes bacterium]|nr:hypothetical protein [Planctomycetota bacterium]